MTVDDFKTTLHELGWNQSEFARKVGLTPVAVSRWVNGEVEIPLWAERHLALLVEVQRLYVTYIEPTGSKVRRAVG